MADVILSVDDAVLRRARLRALQEGSSVNAFIRTALARYSGMDRGLDGFLAASEDLDARSGPDGRGWSRAELHGGAR